eukprot:1045994_1
MVIKNDHLPMYHLIQHLHHVYLMPQTMDDHRTHSIFTIHAYDAQKEKLYQKRAHDTRQMSIIIIVFYLTEWRPNFNNTFHLVTRDIVVHFVDERRGFSSGILQIMSRKLCIKYY